MKAITFTFKVLFFTYFLFFFLATFETPLMADDYGYRWTALNGSNPLLDSIQVAIDYYKNWGGRSLAHFFAHWMMWSYSNEYGFLIYAMINTLVLVTIVYCSYLVVIPSDSSKNQRQHPSSTSFFRPSWNHLNTHSMATLALLLLLMTINAKAHYQTIFWATGAAHYLWMYLILAIGLAALKEFILEGQAFRFSLINLILLLALGFSYENVGLSLCVLIGLRYLTPFFKLKKKGTKSFVFPSLRALFPMGLLLGSSLIMLMAPGNQVREKIAYPDGTGTLFPKIQWWLESVVIFLGRPEGLLTLFVFGILTYKLKTLRTKSLWKITSETPLIFNLGLLCLLMSASYLGHSGNFYGRKSFNIGWVFCLFLISLLLRSGMIEAISKLKLKMFGSVLVLFLILANSRWIYDYAIIKSFNSKFKNREQEILSLKEQGQQDITVNSIANPFGLEDLSEDPHHYINAPYSKILGIHSLRAIPPSTSSIQQ